MPTIFFNSPLEELIRAIPERIGYKQDDKYLTEIYSKIKELEQSKVITTDIALAYRTAASNLVYERTERWCGRTSYCNPEESGSDRIKD
jgi:hypothetical protein